MDGIELQDREFVSAISQLRPPNSSIDSVLDCYRILGQLQEQLDR
jgi:2-hydroxy-4-carboxymuconate semialdehyde hemiacetal dehydrogenase